MVAQPTPASVERYTRLLLAAKSVLSFAKAKSGISRPRISPSLIGSMLPPRLRERRTPSFVPAKSALSAGDDRAAGESARARSTAPDGPRLDQELPELLRYNPFAEPTKI